MTAAYPSVRPWSPSTSKHHSSQNKKGRTVVRPCSSDSRRPSLSSSQNFINTFIHCGWAKRLGYVIVHLGDIQRQRLVDSLSLARHHNDGYLPHDLVSPHALVHFPAVHPRHHDVEQHNVG